MSSKALWGSWAQRSFCTPFLRVRTPVSMTSEFQRAEQLLIRKLPEARLKGPERLKVRSPNLLRPCIQPHPFAEERRQGCYCLDPYHTPLPDYVTSTYSPLSGACFLRPHCFFVASHSFFLLHNCLHIYVWHWCTESQDFDNKQSRDCGLFNLRVLHSALHTVGTTVGTE